MTFHHFLVRIRRPVRHGFMGNNGLFMLVHTGFIRGAVPRSRQEPQQTASGEQGACALLDAIMDIHGFSGPCR